MRRVYIILAPRAYSIIIFGALFCTVAVKLFHAWRMQLIGEYISWILSDVAVLVGIEAVLTALYFGLHRRWAFRMVTIVAAILCTWSVMNGGWIIRTGTQILPAVLLPVVRDPLSALGIVGINLVKMPTAAVILLAPSAIAICFFVAVLSRPVQPNYSRRRLAYRMLVSAVIVCSAAVGHVAVSLACSLDAVSAGMRYNSQLKAVTTFFPVNDGRLVKADLANAKRQIPAFDEIQLELSRGQQQVNHNVVLIVLEGVQYRHTSLYDSKSKLTPYLFKLAQQGAEFTNTRSTLTHTTKVLFGLLTGRYPSASQDLAEAVPVEKPYAGIATILRQQLGFRTAFFQSAKGSFESRPGLVHNLGFDKFWSREDLGDPNAFIGYLACDEFSMLKPITEWIEADEKPFFITILCSVTHDPYEVPEWFAEPAKEPIQRYRQTIRYTDEFIGTLDAELARLNIADKTILCVIGDHGEAFGEHGLLGHERIAFEEVLCVPWVMRANDLIEAATRITQDVGSIDLTPTLLALLGCRVDRANFDGLNALANLPATRKVYFCGWMQQGPAGFVQYGRKAVYSPTNKMVWVHDLRDDPFELVRMELDDAEAGQIADEIQAWRRNSIFRIRQKRTGRIILFEKWLCRWSGRIPSARCIPLQRD